MQSLGRLLLLGTDPCQAFCTSPTSSRVATSPWTLQVAAGPGLVSAKRHLLLNVVCIFEGEEQQRLHKPFHLLCSSASAPTQVSSCMTQTDSFLLGCQTNMLFVITHHDRAMPLLLHHCCEDNKAGQLRACKCMLQNTLQEAFRQHVVLFPNAWGLIPMSTAEVTHMLSCI